ncbi:DUF6326 family protein [Pseudemcibacter aquimaris]|uniref:DUF6326 family protein n=1 Tax=Pseudemcibacter aquimaris TaxID=2857064 RepID=UPI00201386A8|nr:DUF6326 family protein [Pseudemcibacter aquimaris]MCC3862159.1 DUF6326 family protein [Pseudemcibacter aquimaris]
MDQSGKRKLEDKSVPVKIKLALLWAALMFLYVYNDYFSMYLPGTIEDMSTGQIGPLGDATEMVLVSVSMILAIPALMVFLSAALPATYSRWLNVILGVAYTIIEALTITMPHLFYQIVVVFEICVTLSIVYYAIRWPKEA